MIYLYGYLGVGVVVLAVVYGAHLLSKDKESKPLRDLLEAVDPNRTKLSYRIIVTPVLVTLFVIAAWPVVTFMKVKDLRQTKEDSRVAEDREFAVRRDNLQERLTVGEIEMREIVVDPLKAAPELPFGHLNAAWKEFLRVHVTDVELWSFSAQWTAWWGREELRSGYVVVSDGAPAAHFLTVCKILPDEEVDAKVASAAMRST